MHVQDDLFSSDNDLNVGVEVGTFGGGGSHTVFGYNSAHKSTQGSTQESKIVYTDL